MSCGHQQQSNSKWNCQVSLAWVPDFVALQRTHSTTDHILGVCNGEHDAQTAA